MTEAVLNQQYSVLICDDLIESFSVQYLVKKLQKFGCKIDCAIDSFSTEKFLRSMMNKGNAYDYVVLDLKGSEQDDHFEFIDNLDFIPEKNTKTKIVAMTGFYGDCPPEKKEVLDRRCEKVYTRQEYVSVLEHILLGLGIEYHSIEISKQTGNNNLYNSIDNIESQDAKNQVAENIEESSIMENPEDPYRRMEDVVKKIAKRNSMVYLWTILAAMIPIIGGIFSMAYMTGEFKSDLRNDQIIRAQFFNALKAEIENQKSIRQEEINNFKLLLKNENLSREKHFNVLLSGFQKEWEKDRAQRERDNRRLNIIIEKDSRERQSILKSMENSLRADKEVREQTLKRMEEISEHTKFLIQLVLENEK